MSAPARRIVLSSISTRAWEHPADRGALVALRKLRGFDMVLRQISAFMDERVVRMNLLASAVKVTPRQFTRVHALMSEAARSLDLETLPEAFVVASPYLNAMTIGMDSPKIVINSALIDLCDDDELRFVLGHELGHAMSGHAVYRTLLMNLVLLGRATMGLPVVWGVRVITYALEEWSRKSELSCDRAGLLATQDVAAAQRVHMKTASGGRLDDLDTGEFLAQAREFDATEDVRDSLVKWLMLDGTSHPFSVVRAGELQRWVDSGEYAKILTGDYARRDDDRSARLSDEAKAAADSYAESFRTSEDMSSKFFTDLVDGAGSVAGWFGNKFSDLTRPRDDNRGGDSKPGSPPRGPGGRWRDHSNYDDLDN